MLRQSSTTIAVAEMGAPVTLVGSFQGNAQAFQESLRTVPMLIAGALFVARQGRPGPPWVRVAPVSASLEDRFLTMTTRLEDRL